MTFNKTKAMPWIMVAIWICVIWGHSVMKGVDSGMESSAVLGIVRNFANWFFSLDFGWVRNILEKHPEIMLTLENNEQLHFYVRKAGHFTEFFILGLLVLRACRKNITVTRQFIVALNAFWIFVPFVDETIQLFVPGRAGQVSDMLLDMCGYGVALIVSLPFIGLAALIRLIAGNIPSPKKADSKEE